MRAHPVSQFLRLYHIFSRLAVEFLDRSVSSPLEFIWSDARASSVDRGLNVRKYVHSIDVVEPKFYRFVNL